MFDALINLFPVTDLSGAPGPGAAMRLGRNRAFRAWGRCKGDVTGAGATCSFAIQESTDGTGAGGGTWTVVPGAPTIAIVEQAVVVGTTARPEIPANYSPYAPVVAGTSGPLPSVTFTTSKDYVRAVPTLAGTSPVFPGTSIQIEPIDAPILASGR